MILSIAMSYYIMTNTFVFTRTIRVKYKYEKENIMNQEYKNRKTNKQRNQYLQYNVFTLLIGHNHLYKKYCHGLRKVLVFVGIECFQIVDEKFLHGTSYNMNNFSVKIEQKKMYCYR